MNERSRVDQIQVKELPECDVEDMKLTKRGLISENLVGVRKLIFFWKRINLRDLTDVKELAV